MSHKRLTTFQKATALVPLALLSGAWTTSLTLTSSATADGEGSGKLPDGTSIPEQAIKAPASVSNPGEIAPGVPSGSADQVIAGASTNGIPSAALSAYQRAAQVIDSADKGCNIDWTLIAAIGRVESNHGRYGGNTLDSNGVSRPGIYGIPLDGSNSTSKITDTDAGQYDNDPQYDRAVGPMQFIPSTWSVVGVDGDGDGKRDPQDIDDAALATAVYLCSGNEDLSSTKGQQSAVYRYNHSQEYVNLVLSIMRAYSEGDYSSVPTSSAGTTTFTPDYGDSVFASGTTGYHFPKSSSGGKGGSGGQGGSGEQQHRRQQHRRRHDGRRPLGHRPGPERHRVRPERAGQEDRQEGHDGATPSPSRSSTRSPPGPKQLVLRRTARGGINRQLDGHQRLRCEGRRHDEGSGLVGHPEHPRRGRRMARPEPARPRLTDRRSTHEKSPGPWWSGAPFRLGSA